MRAWYKSSLPWIVSGSMVLGLLFMLEALKATPEQPEAKLAVRKLDVALPAPPPPPPPPVKTSRSSSEPVQTSLNIAGLGSGPEVSYSDKPKMELPKVQSLDLPSFSMDASTIQQRMTLDMPLMAVEKLDRVPQVVKQAYMPLYR